MFIIKIMECIICYDAICEKKCEECESEICCNKCYAKLKKTTCPKCRANNFKELDISNEGIFSFYTGDNLFRNGLEKTYQAVTNTNNWENLSNYIVDPNKGFMFSSEEFLSEVSNETERLQVGHSGASWGCCMREMHYIAKHGWRIYVEKRNGARIFLKIL